MLALQEGFEPPCELSVAQFAAAIAFQLVKERFGQARQDDVHQLLIHVAPRKVIIAPHPGRHLAFTCDSMRLRCTTGILRRAGVEGKTKNRSAPEKICRSAG